MVNIRVFILVCVLLITINGALGRVRYNDDSLHHAKRFLGCAELGKSCSGTFSKSCCKGYKCHSSTGKCVSSSSSGSWLGDRNGK